MKRRRMQLVSGAATTRDEESLVEGIKVITREVPPAPANELRDMADTLRSKLGSGVVVIGTRGDGNVNQVAAVTKGLTGRVKAGEVVKRLPAIVGRRRRGGRTSHRLGGRSRISCRRRLAAVQEAIREQLNE